MDVRFRHIGTFEALLVSSDPVKDSEDKVQLGFACPGRTGQGDKSKNVSIDLVAQVFGAILRTKVTKRYLQVMHSVGLKAGVSCTITAAIDAYAIAAEGKGKASNGLWFELVEVQLGDKKIQPPIEQRQEREVAA